MVDVVIVDVCEVVKVFVPGKVVPSTTGLVLVTGRGGNFTQMMSQNEGS